MSWNDAWLLHALLGGLIWAACFYVVFCVGTYLINYIWLNPAAIHQKQEERIAHLEKELGLTREKTVNTGLLRELREIEKQAAQEMGQLAERENPQA